jgi:hypothetical protein
VNSVDHRMFVLINLGAVKKPTHLGALCGRFAYNQADKNHLESVSTNLISQGTKCKFSCRFYWF